MKRTVVGAIVLTLLLLLPASASARTFRYTLHEGDRTSPKMVSLEFDVIRREGEYKYAEDFFVRAKHEACSSGDPAGTHFWFSSEGERARIDTDDDNRFKFKENAFGWDYVFRGKIRGDGRVGGGNTAVGKFRGAYGAGRSRGGWGYGYDHACHTDGALRWDAFTQDL